MASAASSSAAPEVPGAPNDPLLNPQVWGPLFAHVDLFDLLSMRLVNKSLSVAAGSQIRVINLHLELEFPISAASLQSILRAFPNAKRLKLCLGSGGLFGGLRDLLSSFGGASPLGVATAARRALFPKRASDKAMAAALTVLLPTLEAVLPHHFTLSAGPLGESATGNHIMANLHQVSWLKSAVLGDVPYRVTDHHLSGLTALERLYVGAFDPNGGRYGKLHPLATCIAEGAPNLRSLTINSSQNSAELNTKAIRQLARLTNLDELQVETNHGRMTLHTFNTSLAALSHLTRLSCTTLTAITCNEAVRVCKQKGWTYEAVACEDEIAALDRQDGRWTADGLFDGVVLKPPPKLARVMLGVAYMSPALGAWLGACSSLQRLTLHFNDGARHMAHGAWQMLPDALPPGVQLAVQMHGDSEFMSDLLDARTWSALPSAGVAQLKSMQHLELKGVRVGIGAMALLLADLPHLRSLIITRLSLQPDDVYRLLRRAQQQIHARQQQHDDTERDSAVQGDAAQDNQQDEQQRKDQQERAAAGGPANLPDASSATLLYSIAAALPQLRHLKVDMEAMEAKDHGCARKDSKAFLAVSDALLAWLAHGCPQLEYVVLKDLEGGRLLTARGVRAFKQALPAACHVHVLGHGNEETREPFAAKSNDLLSCLGSPGEMAYNLGEWPDDRVPWDSLHAQGAV